jgi:hypothetical protein
MLERRDHGKNLSGKDRIKLAPGDSFRKCTTSWRSQPRGQEWPQGDSPVDILLEDHADPGGCLEC